MTRLELDGVTRRFGETTAVDDVTLTVEDGEFFTLVGPSGCGKTTTLRLIAGFEDVDESLPDSSARQTQSNDVDGSHPSAHQTQSNDVDGGVVRFGGEPMTGVPPEDRDVGIVFQSYALFPHMTVAENVGYGLRFSDPPAGQSREERVADLLELVDLPGFGDRTPDELSGGQRQRVALARALAPQPSVLLLDEPMSALDARLRERLRVQVKEIQSELDITTVYVTHDQEEALSVSDRVAVMHDGRVEQVGTPEEVYRDPASRFVAEFVGDNNVFHSASPVETGGSSVRVGDATFDVGDATVEGDDAAFGGDDDRPAFEVPDGETASTVAVSDTVDALCVRPESLRFGAERNAFPVRVESVEFLGDAYRAHCEWDGRDVLVKTRERPPTGNAVVGFDPADATLL